jgi:hypothetical protein
LISAKVNPIFQKARRRRRSERLLKVNSSGWLSPKCLGGLHRNPHTLALEVLTSVDFIRHNNPGISLEDTIAAIHNWPERKDKLFKNEYIQIAYDHLDTLYGESKLSAGL